MTRPDAAPSRDLHRFARAERIVHRTTAVLMAVCIATAAVLYNGQLAVWIGHRRVVELIHVYAGFALPVPMILGLVSVAYRADLRRLNRFTPVGLALAALAQPARRHASGSGKFNAGQKINAALSAGAILVLLGTGVLMYFPDLARLTWRTGATFVHDWFALALGTAGGRSRPVRAQRPRGAARHAQRLGDHGVGARGAPGLGRRARSPERAVGQPLSGLGARVDRRVVQVRLVLERDLVGRRHPGRQVDGRLRAGEPVLHRHVPVDPQQDQRDRARPGSCS